MYVRQKNTAYFKLLCSDFQLSHEIGGRSIYKKVESVAGFVLGLLSKRKTQMELLGQSEQILCGNDL